MNKKLVVYYSASGATEKAAQVIAEELGADLARLEPVKPYPGFLPFLFAAGAFAVFLGRPRAVKPLSVNLADYTTIVVGTPTWMGLPAPPVRQFVQDTDWAGKQVGLFASCSHMAQDNLVHLQMLIKGATVFGKRVFTAHDLKDRRGTLRPAVKAWVARMAFF